MSYKIKKLQEKKAASYGLYIKPSTNKNKKIDVYDKKTNEKLASIGGVHRDGRFYSDYATYIIDKGQKYADKRRELYMKRHEKYPKIKNNKRTNSWYSDKILW